MLPSRTLEEFRGREANLKGAERSWIFPGDRKLSAEGLYRIRELAQKTVWAKAFFCETDWDLQTGTTEK